MWNYDNSSCSDEGVDGSFDLGKRRAAAEARACSNCFCSLLARFYRTGQLAAACLVVLMPPIGNIQGWIFLPIVLMVQYVLLLTLGDEPNFVDRVLAPIRYPPSLFFYRRPSLLGLHTGSSAGTAWVVWHTWELGRTVFCFYMLYLLWGGGLLSGASFQAAHSLPVNVCSWRFSTQNTQEACDAVAVPTYVRCEQVDLFKWDMCTSQAPIWYNCNSLATWCSCDVVADLQAAGDGGMSVFYATPGSLSFAALTWTILALFVPCLCCGASIENNLSTNAQMPHGCCWSCCVRVGRRIWVDVCMLFTEIGFHISIIVKLALAQHFYLVCWHMVPLVFACAFQFYISPPCGIFSLFGEALKSQKEGVYTETYLRIVRAQRSLHIFPAVLLTLFHMSSVAGDLGAVRVMTVFVASSFWSVVTLMYEDIDLCMGEFIDFPDKNSLLM